jgi:hypothetical protein
MAIMLVNQYSHSAISNCRLIVAAGFVYKEEQKLSIYAMIKYVPVDLRSGGPFVSNF